MSKKLDNDNLAFTSASSKYDVPEVNLKNLTELSEKFLKKAVLPFMGVPLRIDESLKDSQYYIAVSHELYERIEEEQMKRG